MDAGFGSKLLGFVQALLRRLGDANRSTKRLIAIAADSVAVIAAVLISFSIRLGYWQVAGIEILLFTAFELVVCIALLQWIGAYRNVFRFLGARGLIQLIMAAAMVAVPTVIVFGLNSVVGVPRTISVLFPIVFLGLIVINRIVARYVMLDVFGPTATSQRVLIYGAQNAGRQLASAIYLEPGYRLLGYIDDDPELVGTRIENLPIHVSAELEKVIIGEQVDLVLLAIPEVSRSDRAAIVQRLQSTGVKVQTLPGVREIVDGSVLINDLRAIQVADLLSRDTVAPDPELLTRSIEGKDVLVTGAGGSIGSELCRQILAQKPRRLVLFEFSEAALFTLDDELRRVAAETRCPADIQLELGNSADKRAVRRLFEKYTPQVVFHAAAYKHVPIVEGNVIAGTYNNVFGTLYMAEAARASRVERFVLISTDKAVRPTNVMGATKRVCELILQALAAEGGPTIFSMVRFGNVLGSSGSVVPHFERQLERGGPLTVTHRDVTRFFMTISEAAELVIQAGAMATGGEVYLLDMGEPVRIYDLARAMIELAGLTVRDDAHPGGDIEIAEIGLRPGEKLFEELLISAEASPTAHPRIMMADEIRLDWDVLKTKLDHLHDLLDRADFRGVRCVLEELVTGFVAGADSAAPRFIAGSA